MPDKRKKPLTTRQQFDEIRQILKTLAVTTAQHDDQIEALIKVAEKHDRQIASLAKQWEAYVNTLPRQ